MPQRSLAVAAGLLALSLVGCADSGGGPFHRPDVSTERILGPAVLALAADGRFGTAGPIGFLERLDPAAILARGPSSIVLGVQLPPEAEPPADRLSEATRSILRDALKGRQVDFLPNDPAPLAPEDPRCATPDAVGLFVRLAVLSAMAVHGDVYVVIAEAAGECGDVAWAAARMIWEPRGLIGGEWVVREISDGAIRPSGTPDEVLIELAVMAFLDDDLLGSGPLVVLDQLDAATVLESQRLPDVIAAELHPGSVAPARMALPDNVRDILVKYRDDRSVSFVAAQPEVVDVNELGCGRLAGGATFVRLALVPGSAADEPRSLVIAETFDGCATTWFAARLVRDGGDWRVMVIEGGSVSV